MRSADVVICVQCGQSFDCRAPGHARRVLGWEINRTQGGANQITLPERLDEWLCNVCVGKRRAGFAWDQLDLFG